MRRWTWGEVFAGLALVLLLIAWPDLSSGARVGIVLAGVAGYFLLNAVQAANERNTQ